MNFENKNLPFNSKESFSIRNPFAKILQPYERVGLLLFLSCFCFFSFLLFFLCHLHPPLRIFMARNVWCFIILSSINIEFLSREGRENCNGAKRLCVICLPRKEKPTVPGCLWGKLKYQFHVDLSKSFNKIKYMISKSFDFIFISLHTEGGARWEVINHIHFSFYSFSQN